MNLGSIPFSGIVDMGFVLLVSAACLRSLGAQTIDGEKIAQKWRGELRELERVLRDLISEASTASNTLDRRLVKRKTELEALLKRTEAEQLKPKASKAAVSRSSRKSNDGWELGEFDGVPNDSWLSERKQVVSPTEADELEDEADFGEPDDNRDNYFADAEDDLAETRHGGRAQADSDALGGLEDLLEQAEDRVEISSKVSASIAKPAPAAPRKPSIPTPALAAVKSAAAASQAIANSLTSQIELIKTQQDEDETFKKLAITDPTAYRIARRLLAAGTEIHIVARKLDIPIGEVRMLDRLMREEGRPPVEIPIGPNYKPTEVVPRSKIVRDRVEAAAAERSLTESIERKRTATPAAPRESVREPELKPLRVPVVEDIRIEDAIEREMALL